MGPFDWIAEARESLLERHLLRSLTTRLGPQQPVIQLNGQSLINFGSNDYLGLANEPRVRTAIRSCLDALGAGSGASPLVLGHTTEHEQLELSLARFEQTEAALVFPTGYAANVGTICALVGKSDAIFSDAKNHASIIDGCRLSGARIHVFPHRDMDALSQQMTSQCPARRRLIVTDGLFSMDGDLAPLARLVELAHQHAAMLMVDEAHATGVLGPSGRGACDLAGICEDACLIRTGTLSKALGALGGFVTGSRSLVEWIVNTARPYIFSTAAPAILCRAALTSLEIVQYEPERRARVLHISQRLRAWLRDHEFCTTDGCGPIVPIVLGDASRALLAADHLRQRGMFVPAIRPPSVPAAEALLRISLSADHHDDMLDQLTDALRGIR